LSRASSVCASAARNCASSEDVSSRTSRSPGFTKAPDSKAISVTLPAISGATVTPCAALTEPTADSVSGQVSSCATADAMVSTGTGGAVLRSVLICNVFTAASPPATATTMRMPDNNFRFIIFPWIES
jgi:hypothetical protein